MKAYTVTVVYFTPVGTLTRSADIEARSLTGAARMAARMFASASSITVEVAS